MKIELKSFSSIAINNIIKTNEKFLSFYVDGKQIFLFPLSNKM